MLDLIQAPRALPDLADQLPAWSPAAYVGEGCLSRMLDEIDYGMLLVDVQGRVIYRNHAARLELDDDEHPLRVAEQRLQAAEADDAGALDDALDAARRGLRRLLTLGREGRRVSVSVVPLAASPAAAAPTLLVLGKRRVGERLSLHGYARCLNLTPAETRVLELLCAGVRPTAIAERQRVAVSTVRTQIGSLRAKTGAASISDLVREVAVLPPLVGALRQVTRAG